MKYYSAIERKEILPFPTTWMDLEGIMLRETSQRQIPYDFTYLGNIKTKQNRRNKTAVDSDTEKSLVVTKLVGKEAEGDKRTQ